MYLDTQTMATLGGTRTPEQTAQYLQTHLDHWDEHGTFPGRVERVEPPRFISFRWARPAGAEPTEGNSTLVEFILSPEGDGTRLQVVESGFRELGGTDEENVEYAEGNTRGWAKELGELREYVSEHVGAPARR